MKSEITEILLPAGSKVYKGEYPTYVFLKAVLFCGLIFGAGLAFYRYEVKFQEMEMRVSELTDKVLELEEHTNTPVADDSTHRNKRQAEYPWVVRSADGNPMLNRRGDEGSTEEGLLTQRRRRVGRRRTTEQPELRRNYVDETFYTTDARGRRFHPSGLKEMHDRLPAENVDETENMHTDTRHAPELRSRTRALPLSDNYSFQRMGRGNNQVAARVVTFDEPETPKSESVVAHFVADVSNFTSADNPRLRNSDGVFQIWKPEEWNTKDALSYDKNDGTLTVLKSGVYYLYAQIHYHDENVEGFKLEINEKPVLQCTSKHEFNSCFTAGLTRINENDKIVVKNIGQNIFSIFKPEKSFFGLMRVSEIQV